MIKKELFGEKSIVEQQQHGGVQHGEWPTRTATVRASVGRGDSQCECMVLSAEDFQAACILDTR
jgi:hypothetical protein